MTCPYNPEAAMKHGTGKHHRRSIRMPGYDYSQPGAYFVTICTQGRECLFHDPVLRSVVETHWQAIPGHASHIALDAWVVMPNHLHGIIVITHRYPLVGASHSPARAPTTETVGPDGMPPFKGHHARNDSPLQQHGAPPGSLGAIVGNFKSVTGRCINRIRHTPGVRVWQRNYYEHVVRNERALQRIREYILNNPARWDVDIENPDAWQRGKAPDAARYYAAIWGEPP